jgi:Na+/glutamate symporter
MKELTNFIFSNLLLIITIIVIALIVLCIVYSFITAPLMPEDYDEPPYHDEFKNMKLS